jgi:AbrB family looped-hinge helix DNA binding protein
MRATIDAGGRIVVPKDVRERLGLLPGHLVDLIEVDGHLEVAPTATPITIVEREGRFIAVPQEPLAPMTADDVRAALEGVRR